MKNKLFKKISLMEIATISAIALCGIGGATAYAFVSNSFDTSKSSGTIWNEVSIKEGAYKVLPTYFDFDVDYLISESDYIFSGTVIDRKEYEVSWTDDNGEQWGPYPSSILEVKIDKDYWGESPVNGDTILVYSPESLSANIEGTLQLKENYEYIFITRNLDDEFIAEKSPDDKFEQEKHADVYITNSRDNIISISDTNVVVYKEFFDKDFSELNDKSSQELSSSNAVITDVIVESNDFITFNRLDFEAAFDNIITSKKVSSHVSKAVEECIDTGETEVTEENGG